MIELHRFPSELISTENNMVEQQEFTFSDRDLEIFHDFSTIVKETIGKEHANKVVLIGGTALRLLENVVGIENNGVFSGSDIDSFYCGTDKENLIALRQAFNQLPDLPRVDIFRFLNEYEIKKTIPQKFVQNSEGNLFSTMIWGHIYHKINQPLEAIEVTINGDQIYTLSPTILFHLYALRVIGGVKDKDWKEDKHKRLLEVNRRLNDIKGFNMGLRRPRDYPEFHQARHRARKVPLIPQIGIAMAWIDNKVGRPNEKLRIASKLG